MSDRFSRETLAKYVTDRPTAQPSGTMTKKSAAAVIAGNAADAASTIWALKQGAREANPVAGPAPSTAKVIALKSAGTLAELAVLSRLAKRHPTLANGVAKGIGAGLGVVAISNTKKGQQSRR